MCANNKASDPMDRLNHGMSEVMALELRSAPVDPDRDIFTVSWSVADTYAVLMRLREPDVVPVVIEVYRLSDPVDGYVELAVITPSDLAERVLAEWRANGGHESLGDCVFYEIFNATDPNPPKLGGVCELSREWFADYDESLKDNA